MARRPLTDAQHKAFIGESAAVTWYVKAVRHKDASRDGWVDAEFRAWDGSSSMYICDDPDVVDRAVVELKAYSRALRRARADVKADE